MDDDLLSDTVILLPYIDLKNLFTASSVSNLEVHEYTANINDTHISQATTDTDNEQPKTASDPITISSKHKKIEIIENFFDKPNTFEHTDLIKHTKNSRDNKGTSGSDSFLRFPNKIVRSLIRFTSGSF
jgi:hypothetical protein